MRNSNVAADAKANVQTNFKNRGETMNLKKQTLGLALMVTTAFTMTASIVFAQDPAEKTIVGVWRTAVTPRNCQTGDPVAASFPGLFTFHRGGTMSEWGVNPAVGQTPALRSPGHGLWQREQGWQEYSFTFIHYRYDATGAFVGSQKITANLQLGASGDEFTASSTIEVYAPNGNVVAMGCATAVGTRFQ